jgi:16S rRNA A1518/A1519 N6-dimethyltransferase RsmA/KsgA/DIM1 with predicted DNA glycosylase/AP lyase activity
LVAFERTSLPDGYAQIKRVVEAAFAHRRKTLANSFQLSGLADRAAANQALATIRRPTATRAEELSPHEFVALAQSLR